MAPRSNRALALLGIAAIAALAVAAAMFAVEPQGRGLSNGPCPSETCLFQISDSIVVISGSGAGAMNLTINNEANYAFTDISIAKTNPSLGDLVNYAPFTYGGVAVTATNRLPIGEHSSGLYEFSSGGAIGSTYTFTVTATMTNGQAMTEKTNIEAG